MTWSENLNLKVISVKVFQTSGKIYGSQLVKTPIKVY